RHRRPLPPRPCRWLRVHVCLVLARRPVPGREDPLPRIGPSCPPLPQPATRQRSWRVVAAPPFAHLPFFNTGSSLFSCHTPRRRGPLRLALASLQDYNGGLLLIPDAFLFPRAVLRNRRTSRVRSGPLPWLPRTPLLVS